MSKIFYVCSYGGSGSTMLCNALLPYGKVFHIHSRNPPEKLEYVGNDAGGNTSDLWFNGKQIPEDQLHKYHVIFIYKNPIHCIYSRFLNAWHLKHIQSPNCSLQEVLQQNKDLYGIEEFYNNYTTFNNKRNYKIYSIKYEDIFEKQTALSRLFNIGPLNLVKMESNRTYNTEEVNQLKLIYKNLLETQNNNSFIMVNHKHISIPKTHIYVKKQNKKKHFLNKINFY